MIAKEEEVMHGEQFKEMTVALAIRGERWTMQQ